MIFLFTHSAEYNEDAVSKVLSRQAFGNIKD